VGKDSKGIAARSGVGESDRLNDCEAHHVGVRPEKDRGGTEGEVGEVQSGEEEGSVGPNWFGFS
jgi:hypothetical protein